MSEAEDRAAIDEIVSRIGTDEALQRIRRPLPGFWDVHVEPFFCGFGAASIFCQIINHFFP